MRLPDWEDRLAAYLEGCRKRPFEWGAHDCALFAAGAVQAETGLDFAAIFRGRYTTAAGAARALKRQGFADSHGPFDAALGARVGVLMAGRGDVVALAGHDAVGIVWAGGALFVGEEGAREGLVAYPLAACSHGWRVA